MPFFTNGMRKVAENAIHSEMLRVIIIWSLLLACLFSIISYAFFVNKAIFEAVATGRISADISDTNARLGALQSRFLSLQSEATLSKAGQLGLKETDTERFISRKALGRGLSLRDEI